MEASSHHKKMAKKTKKHPTHSLCNTPFCFFCTMKEADPFLRASKITECFKQMPQRDDQESILTLSSLWNIAMNQPNNPEFPSLGIFESMAKLICRGINDKKWLFRDQNIYIPYYAAHIIGSYTMNKAEFAKVAVESGVIPPLMELFRGKISWIEQRVAVRALAHLVSHDRTFESVAENGEVVVKLAMEHASTCLDKIYDQFICVKETLKYQSNLLTRGHGGTEFENRKAEEWACQSQRWSLYVLNCFALKERFLSLICRKKFLKSLSEIWGGVEVLRNLCKTGIGRKSIVDLEKVLKSLCNLARSSSDEWQFMAIESLLNLLKDPETRFKVYEIAILSLVDLVELETCNRKEPKLGDTITRTLLQDYHKIKYGYLNLHNERAKRALEEVWELKVEKKRREKMMSEKEVRKRKLLVGILKKQGNHKFRAGEIKRAAMKYTEALNLCIPKMRKERVVLHSNRAQCFLFQRNPEAAISDTTRALCLSKEGNPHIKSLWRRSQAYDMKGLAKESLMDCILFVRYWIKSKHEKREKIPYYAACMIKKQMNAAWIFGSVKSRTYEEVQEFMAEYEGGQIGLVMKMQKEKEMENGGAEFS